MLRTLPRNLLKLSSPLLEAGQRHNKVCKQVQCEASQKCEARQCSPNLWEPLTGMTILDNGIRVITEKTNSPLLGITLMIEAGPRFEIACNNGVTHFIEHLAYKGLGGVDRRTFEESVLQMGAKFSAKTTQELQWFSVACLLDDAPRAVEILSSIISNLRFDSCEMEYERYNTWLEMKGLDINPKALVFENLIQSAFQGTSLGQRVIGPTENLARFDEAYLQNYKADHYQPWRLVFATSGNVEHQAMTTYIRNSLGHVTPTSCAVDPPVCRYTGSSVIYRDDSLPFAHVCIAVESPGYESPEYIPMMVVKNVVGKWSKTQLAPGVWPELAMRCADTNLCESFECFYIAYRDVGLWGVYFVSKALEIEDMMFNVQDIWMNLCTTTAFADAERARNATVLDLFSRRQGSIVSSLDVATDGMYRCSRPTLTELCDAVSRVRESRVRELADKYLYDRCPVVSAVGPTEGVPDYTRIRSSMYWLRL